MVSRSPDHPAAHPPSHCRRSCSLIQHQPYGPFPHCSARSVSAKGLVGRLFESSSLCLYRSCFLALLSRSFGSLHLGSGPYHRFLVHHDPHRGSVYSGCLHLRKIPLVGCLQNVALTAAWHNNRPPPSHAPRHHLLPGTRPWHCRRAGRWHWSEEQRGTVIDASHRSDKDFRKWVAADKTVMSEGLYFAVLFGHQLDFLWSPLADRSLSSTATGRGNGWRLKIDISSIARL